MKSQDKDQYIPTAPQCPENLKETGLNSGMLSEMVLKAIYTKGAMLGMDISKSLCLPFKIIEEALQCCCSGVKFRQSPFASQHFEAEKLASNGKQALASCKMRHSLYTSILEFFKTRQ